MTNEEIGIIHDLRRVRFIPGSWDKRFSQAMAALKERRPGQTLTQPQSRWLKILHHKFRRQIPAHRCATFCRVEELAGSLEE